MAFAADVQDETIALSSPIAIARDVTIEGRGDARPGPTLTGATTLLTIDAGATVAVTGLRIAEATAPDAAAVDHWVSRGSDAGANVVENRGMLTLAGLQIVGNVAGAGGDNESGAGAGGGGSVVANSGTLVVVRTTVSGNRGGDGGSSTSRGGAEAAAASSPAPGRRPSPTASWSTTRAATAGRAVAAAGAEAVAPC